MIISPSLGGGGSDKYLPLSGGELTGPVKVLEPTEAANPVTVQFMENAIQAAIEDTWKASYGGRWA